MTDADGSAGTQDGDGSGGVSDAGGTSDGSGTTVPAEVPDAVLADLYAVIEDRKERMPDDSYTASLFEGGENAILEKLGEESTEVLLAAKAGDEAEIAHESADLVYHLLVLLAATDVGLESLLAELDRRAEK